MDAAGVIAALVLLAVPPALLATAAASIGWKAARGTLRRAVAYRVVSRPRRVLFGALVLFGLAAYTLAGTFGVLGTVGTLSPSQVSAASGPLFLLGSFTLFGAVVFGVRDSPVAEAEAAAVAEFKGELLSLGMVEGVE